jgi:hypothetical protein
MKSLNILNLALLWVIIAIKSEILTKNDLKVTYKNDFITD